jgi:hypothetical protein
MELAEGHNSGASQWLQTSRALGKLAFKMTNAAWVMYKVDSFSASTEPVSFKL